MAGLQRNGVDAALDIILALARRGGSGPSSALAAELGIPRASFHRMTRILAQHGIVICSRGKVGVGPVANKLVSAFCHEMQVADRKRDHLLGEAVRPVVTSTEIAAPKPPPLSRPAIATRRKRFRIGFSNGAMDNPWQVALVHSVEFAASRLSDILECVTVVHADGDAEKQTEDILSLEKSGVDGLLVSAVSPRKLAPVSAHLMRHGVPVVFVERGGTPNLPCASFVTSDNVTIGKLTAEWLARTLEGNGLVMMLFGHADPELTQSRQAAAAQVFARYPNIRTVVASSTDFNRHRAYGTAMEVIEHHGERIAGVWCDSGLNSAGSIQAFLDAGYKPGHVPPHTGGDLNLSYKLALGAGVPLGSIDYPPVMGIRAFEILLCALRGSWIPKYLDVASPFITTRTGGTRPTKPHLWAEERVRWDMPDELIMGAGLGAAYNPAAFKVNYPGNHHNRSSAEPRLGP
ncbi:substrate-binding domain-containing protein [Rhizobium lusitanum]|uniref:Substrate-binding domain-containing protein n=1 Tax=Rhizobium lusitanum TaxID=293958 RepID=A0A6L9UA33_9HYPH|nr:substrate-binding domain-containing protein [Rhizobium lusitanum]NEI72239.1 substrate-binding domain-containing protein [Rhizobium lusitanum]